MCQTTIRKEKIQPGFIAVVTGYKEAQYGSVCQVFQNQQGLIVLPTVDIDILFTNGTYDHEY